MTLVGVMQREDLPSKKIVAWCDVRRDGDATEDSPGSYQVIGAPLPPGGIIPFLPNLEPDITLSCLGLGQVHQTWALVGWGQHFIAGRGVPPLEADGGTSFNCDLPVCRSGGLRKEPTGHVGFMDAVGTHGDISKRVVLVSSAMRTHTIELRQCVTIDDQ
jgi:hypothetical protein